MGATNYLYQRIRCFLAANGGEVSIWAVFGGMCILVVYLLDPQLFYNFFDYIQRQVFSSLHKAFGTDGPNNPTGTGTTGGTETGVRQRSGQ